MWPWLLSSPFCFPFSPGALHSWGKLKPHCWLESPHVKPRGCWSRMLQLVLYVRFPLCQRQTDRQTEAERLFLRQKQWPAIFLHLLGLFARGRGLETVYTKDKDPLFLSSWGIWEWCLPRAREQEKRGPLTPCCTLGKEGLFPAPRGTAFPCPHCRDGTVEFPSGLADWQ